MTPDVMSERANTYVVLMQPPRNPSRERCRQMSGSNLSGNPVPELAEIIINVVKSLPPCASDRAPLRDDAQR
jgi:hypothetical protein